VEPQQEGGDPRDEDVMENHEDNWPLIAFTTLAPLSVGALLGLIPGRMDHGLGAAIVLAVAVAALAASLLHLGHPLRSILALLEVRSSWLSREVALFSIYLAGLFCWTVVLTVPNPFPPAHPLSVPTVIAGFAAILATGMVYRLRARPAWDHWTAVAAFPVSALAAGLPASFALRMLTGRTLTEGNFTWLLALAVGALCIAPVLTALRLGRLRSGSPEELESWQLATGKHRTALSLRVLGSALAVALLATGGPAGALAWVAALAGEAADRVLFFQTAVPVSLPARAGAPRAGLVTRTSRGHNLG
jgi:anaerobic dimethyl sulfoxide reductase subunit C (anchor subunit)